jgi:acyl carrier protein
MCKHVDPKIENRILAAIANHIGTDKPITLDQTLCEAGGDSLDTIEIPWVLSELFDSDPDLQIDESMTIGDIIKAVAP